MIVLYMNLFQQHLDHCGLGQPFNLNFSLAFGFVNRIPHDLTVETLIAVNLFNPVVLPGVRLPHFFNAGVAGDEAGNDLAGNADEGGTDQYIVSNIIDTEYQVFQQKIR